VIQREAEPTGSVEAVAEPAPEAELSIIEAISSLKLSADTVTGAASACRNAVQEVAQARERAVESANVLVRIARHCTSVRDWGGASASHHQQIERINCYEGH
jgi:prophage DNA circulation protein